MIEKHSLPFDPVLVLESTATRTEPTLAARAWAAIKAWKSDKHSLPTLQALNDRMLADVGFTREQVSSSRALRAYKCEH